MTVCIICFYLFGKGLVTGLPVSIRLISSEIVYLIPVLLCLLIGRDSIGKLIPHRVPRISTLLMTILFVLLLEPLMTCLNVFTMLFSTNYVLETRSDLSIISRYRFSLSASRWFRLFWKSSCSEASLQVITGKKESLQPRS